MAWWMALTDLAGQSLEKQSENKQTEIEGDKSRNDMIADIVSNKGDSSKIVVISSVIFIFLIVIMILFFSIKKKGTI